MKVSPTRIAKATKAAQNSFWHEFASHFPEITTGDFHDADERAFDWACSKAISAWLTYNPPHTIKLECYTCCLDRVQSVRQKELGAIWLRCQKCGCERPLNLKDLEERP